MTTAHDAAVRAAYDACGAAWGKGPARMYDALAEALVDRSPEPVAGRLLADIGAGTGAASRAVLARGGRVVAIDASPEMLTTDANIRPPATVGTADALPIRDRSVDGVVAAFCLNHMLDPVAALREMTRIARPGAVVLVSLFSAANNHPAKTAVEGLAARWGYRRPHWYALLKDTIEPTLSTTRQVAEVLLQAGLVDIDVVETPIVVGVDSPRELAEWRLGMPQLAPWIEALPAESRQRFIGAAIAAVAAQPLVPVVLLAASRTAA